MKRLRPLALIAASKGEYKLRCRPKFDQITQEEHAKLFLLMRSRAVNQVDDERELVSEFSFTFNEDGAVLQDDRFFSLTGDDYGELWINRSVDCFSMASENGVDDPDSPGCKLRPYTLLVDEANSESLRRYTVVFRQDNVPQTKEYTFTVEGGKGNTRTISWMHGSYKASWESKKWTFAAPPPADDLNPLLLSIIRLDEAIYLELMPYAF
jgi:hypothetical protein